MDVNVVLSFNLFFLTTQPTPFLSVRFLLFRPFLLLDLHFHDVIGLGHVGYVAPKKKYLD